MGIVKDDIISARFLAVNVVDFVHQFGGQLPLGVDHFFRFRIELLVVMFALIRDYSIIIVLMQRLNDLHV